ncbi:hypothetical protein PLICRDRAFT_276152 [Plicaturopsis crispa FD-325 SS-3]|nr:hypothetical protein PLICRDRAFT_276152 [Plicaturopsis crispa FD-325 SS-3]
MAPKRKNTMAPKRKNTETDEAVAPSTGRERKKQKVAFARTIDVQSTSHSGGQNVVAGPSKKTTVDSLKGLPTSIDVERFAETRSFEINAMQNAMKSAREASTQRAWQALPRHLRRRAASHDVRRVPARLRGRARAEMDIVKKKSPAKPKRGAANRVSRTESFLKRQREKTWLETHIWHAKRMPMENLWGYRLAITPTEKSFRPSHRASVHGSILHDASYQSLIELKGPEHILRTLLETCCDPQGQGPGAKRYLTGARVLNTHIYKPGSYPFDLIAPITVMWRPSPPVTNDSVPPKEPGLAAASQPAQGTASTSKPKRKGKEKEQVAESSPPSAADSPRTVWIFSHPGPYIDVFAALGTSASLAIDAQRQSNASVPETNTVEVEIADLREHVNVFEIMGPRANQIIKGALTPVVDDEREEFKKFWAALTDLQTSGSVPRGMVVGFKIYDPRLKFPPKNAKPRTHETGSQQFSPALATFPTAAIARSEIWDDEIRTSLKKPRFNKKTLDERRSKLLVPGTALAPLRQDDRVPVLMIQRSLESTSTTESQPLHGWTLIIPSGWSMPFFSSLTFTGTRVGGQRERQTQCFESGTLCFPRDYPFTRTHDVFVAEREAEERALWERKPPAKRVNWDKIGTRSPWRPDWEVILRIGEAEAGPDKDGLLPTQREEPSRNGDVRPWLLRGTDTKTIVENASNMLNHGAGLLAEVNKLRTRRLQDPLSSSVRGDDLLRGALVMVRVKMCGRGSPQDMAIIYAVHDEEWTMWDKVFELKKQPRIPLQDEEVPEESQLLDAKPAQESIVGYVTTGNFSLSRGEGFAIGAISLAHVLCMKQQASKHRNPRALLVKIRDRDGFKCWPAYVDILEG